MFYSAQRLSYGDAALDSEELTRDEAQRSARDFIRNFVRGEAFVYR